MEIGTERGRTAEKYLEDMKEGVQVSQHIIGTKQGRTVEKYLEDMK